MKNLEDIKKEAHSSLVQDYEAKLAKLNSVIANQGDTLKAYEEKFKKIDQTLLKGHKATLDRLNRLLVEKDNEIMTYKKKYLESDDFAKKLVGHSKDLEKVNSELKVLVNEMDAKFEAQKTHYISKMNEIWARHEKELSMASHEYMEKELELRSKIESLQQDLAIYYDVIRGVKVKKDKLFASINELMAEYDKKPERRSEEVIGMAKEEQSLIKKKMNIIQLHLVHHTTWMMRTKILPEMSKLSNSCLYNTKKNLSDNN
jgi:hypothetical protein